MAHGFVVYFGFFTVLTNILVALVLTSACLRPASRAFLGQPGTRSAVLVYIAMVGIIYSVLLRPYWKPSGVQLITDSLLHDVLPPLYFLYWIGFVPKGALPVQPEAVQALPIGSIRGGCDERIPCPSKSENSGKAYTPGTDKRGF